MNTSAESIVRPGRPTAAFMRRRVSRLVALGFGCGLAPFGAGTVGTLWAWVSFLVLDRWLGDAQWALLIGIGIAYGIHACGKVAAELGTDDPRAIVWDEIIAFWLVLWIAQPASLAGQFAAFVLFRFFDIAKPPPVGYIDRRLSGGTGILADDIVAAGLALFVIALWRSWT
ncbi:MAG: phosphatidylglycerophosphatase A [Burkholderiaceae bacterium]